MVNSMIDIQDDYIYIWQPEGDSAVLTRVFGRLPQVEIPESVGDHRITKIDRYCFADKEQLPVELEDDRTKAQMDNTMRPLCGDYIELVYLPDSVISVGDCAFYGCSNLHQIDCGRNLAETGSDAFLNCTRLRKIKVRGSINEKSGVRTMLNQISSDVKVVFTENNITTAVVFFPEYYEGYDEIGPAHIFGLNIEGEGFRARQCFKDGVIDLTQYDSIFQKASIEENEKTLSRMALGRLQYPAGLGGQYRNMYTKHITDNGEAILKRLIDNKELSTISFLCKNKLVLQKDVEKSIGYAADSAWAEGAASLMKWKNDYYGNKQKNNYGFDAF